VKDSLSRTARICVIGSTSLLPILVLPVMVGGFVDLLGLSESEAGWLASAGFFGAAGMALPLAFRIHRLDLRKLAWLGLLLMAVTDGISISAASLPITLLIGLRMVSGAASAAAYGAVMSSFASWREPDRAYGFFMAVQFAVSAVGLFLLPHWLPDVGIAGLFGLFTIADVLALLFVTAMPDRQERKSRAELGAIEWKIIFTATALAVLVAIGLFETANMAQFTYVERIGVDWGLQAGEIGFVLGLATLLGIPAAFSVTWIGSRFGYFRPILVAVIIESLALVMLMQAADFYTYLLATSLLAIGWAVALPYFQGLEASLDKGGSVVVAGAFATGAGGFVGPAGAAMLVSPGHYNTMLMAIIVCMALVVVFTLFVTLRLPE
jgi:MFS family permease